MRPWGLGLMLAALVVAVMLMGLPLEHGWARPLSLLGLGVLVGSWLLVTRHGSRIPNSGSLHNDKMLREIETRLTHFETPELLTQAAAIYLERDKLKKAQQLLERALELATDGESNRTRYLLGQLHLRRREPSKAWPLFDAVYRADSNYQFGEIKLWAARTYLALHEPETALALVNEFLKRERGHFVALHLKGEALWNLTRTDEAKAVYNELLEGLQHAPAATRDKLADAIRTAQRRLKE